MAALVGETCVGVQGCDTRWVKRIIQPDNLQLGVCHVPPFPGLVVSYSERKGSGSLMD